MASKRRPGIDPKAGFRNQKQETSSGVHPVMLKQARQSGQLNLSSRGLSEGNLSAFAQPYNTLTITTKTVNTCGMYQGVEFTMG